MKTLRMNLSVSSIRKAQKQLEAYKGELIEKTRLLAERLAERGVEIAKMEIVNFDAVFTGELLDSIHSKQEDSSKYGATFAIVADSKHAIYVEMGTGTVGASHPYPGKLPVIYAQGKHFVTLAKPFGKFPAGTYGWFYYRDGQLFFTEGMPSRPFLYNTSLELQEIIIEVAQEVFGNGGDTMRSD